MLKRTVLLCLGLWLIAASALSAQASPCKAGLNAPMMPVAETAASHCDMMAAPDAPADERLPEPGTSCCCPAILAALQQSEAPQAVAWAFQLPATFPMDADATSRAILPEPRPPKA